MHETKRPNLLFIMTDQQRFDYMGCAGASSFLRTPNLDRLAERGMRFTNCFTNSPLCAPARIGLATGLDPQHSGALDNSSFLQPEHLTYYMRLRDHGYRVGCVGKLDLAKPDRYNGRYGDRPCLYRWGFTHPEEVEGKDHSLRGDQPVGPYGHWLEEQDLYDKYLKQRRSRRGQEQLWKPSELPAETFLDAYQGQRAVEWMQRITDDFPWHLFVSFSGPHMPHDPPREYFDRCADVDMPPAVPKPEVGQPRCYAGRPSRVNDPDLMNNVRRAYCAYIELIDEWVGRILDVLEQRGMADNTYVVFSSDHGEMLGDLGMFGKSVPYEPSLHVPLIAAGPGIPGAQVCEALVELSDVNPTLCTLAGLPPQPGIDASSFVHCLRDPFREHRTDILASMRSWQCVRTEQHKLVENHNDAAELYDLQADPQEETNLFPDAAQQQKELIADLRGRMRQRQRYSPHGQRRGQLVPW